MATNRKYIKWGDIGGNIADQTDISTPDANNIKGGWRAVSTLVERNAIPSNLRSAFMVVFVAEDFREYMLSLDLTTWIDVTPVQAAMVSVNLKDPRWWVEGVSNYDATSAYQGAANYLLTTDRGGTVICPSGTYESGNILLDSSGPLGVSIVGFVGDQGHFIRLKAGTNDAWLTATDNAFYFFVERMTINGNQANQSGTSHGIYLPDGSAYGYAPSCRIYDVNITNFLTDNIHIGWYRSLVTLERVGSEICGRHALYCGSVDNEVANCQFGRSQSHCVYLRFANIDFSNCDIFGSIGGSGLYAYEGCQGVTAVNCTFNGNAQHGTYFENNTNTNGNNFSFANCMWESNGQSAANTYDNFHSEGCEGLSLSNCKFGITYGDYTYTAYPRYHVYLNGHTSRVPLLGCWYNPLGRSTGDINAAANIIEISNRGVIGVSASEIATGTLPEAQLTANVMLKSVIWPTVSGAQTEAFTAGSSTATTDTRIRKTSGTCAGSMVSGQFVLVEDELAVSSALPTSRHAMAHRDLLTSNPSGTLGAVQLIGHSALSQTGISSTTRHASAYLIGSNSGAVYNTNVSAGTTGLGFLYAHVYQIGINSIASSGSVTVPEAASLFVAAPAFTAAAGTTINVTNYSGIDLPAPSISGTVVITNNYGVRQRDAAAKNYFAGGIITDCSSAAATPSANEIRTGAGAVKAGTAFYVGANQVIGAQGAAVADATDAASAITQLNALLARCRAHGLIAT